MKFEYRLKFNDFQEASDLSSAYSPVKVVKAIKISLIACLILVLIPAFTVLSKGNVVPQKAWTAIGLNYLGLNIACCAMGYLLFLQDRFLVKRSWENSTDDFKNEICVEANEIELKTRTTLSESTTQWAIYTCWEETSNLFVIYHQNSSFYNIIPKRAFVNEDQACEFRQLLRANILNKKKNR
jgi:hypothetical protein